MVLIGNAALHTNELLSDGSVFAPLMCSARTKMSLPMRLLYLMLSDKSFIESCRKSRTIFGRSKNKEAVVNGSNGTHTHPLRNLKLGCNSSFILLYVCPVMWRQK
mmetsp:Transcript_11219/g.16746  ORF Transcript_11219/g.16746 Transcript_11219/m.16746 type:complete len:105 (+) Transcript_11219:509-823(+)